METEPTGRAIARVILAHGAGAPMTSPFMEQMAALLAIRGIAVTRFEFSYMAARRTGGKRRPPPKAETLVPEYAAAVAAIIERDGTHALPLLVGGKSMGGRVASLAADELHRGGLLAGVFALGYPFHPPGMPDKLRTGHLEALSAPMLIVQGERDPFGSRDEVEALRLSPTISLMWAPDGDHDLGPRGGKGFTRRGNMEAAADALAAFAGRIADERT
ncbi:MAG: alpha/beta hydrolase [Hyphomicrobiaceae bacterium]|nr:alpha/beta hydrolase [Hyphomicrobiaceae bacterium]